MYYVWIKFPDGRIVRRGAWHQLPNGNFSIVAVDNGQQDKEYYRQLRTKLKADANGNVNPKADSN